MDQTSSEAYQVIWKNFGKTPAFITGIRLGLSTDDDGADPATMPRYDMPFGAIVGPGDGWPRGRVSISSELQRERDEQARHIWLCGEISYLDIHGAKHRSWFCRAYTGTQFVLDDNANEAFNGYD